FLLARIPARVPGTVDAEAQPGRIDLLTHYFFSFAGFLAAAFLGAAALDLPEDLVLPSALGAAALVSSFFGASSRFSSTMMVICAKNFSMPPALPRARAWKRFITRFLPTLASLTTRSSTSRS